MSRIRKENINTSFFHIMVQGNNKEYIFNCTEDIEKYIKIMKDTKEEINTVILAYCIMSNHAHILIHEENIENLIRYMHKVNLLYAKYYNRRYNRVGYVFRDRYKTQPIYSENHLLSCVRYIHNNPVKAHICEKANQYKYSSYDRNLFFTNTEIEKNIRKNMNLKEDSSLEPMQQFIFMENEQNKEEQCKELLQDILIEKNITKEELSQKEEMINLIIKRMKLECGISYRMLENILGINRKKLRKIETRFDNTK